MSIGSGPRWVAGVDGCSSGWVVVLRDRLARTHTARVVASFHELLILPEAPEVIAIDVPIGLLTTAVAGGRECERLARRVLRTRASSVFSSPTRPALAMFRKLRDYRAVSGANRGGLASAPGLSKQTFAILPKIDEVDAALSPRVQAVVREVHPELCFAEANGGSAMAHSKKTTKGQTERMKLLAGLGFEPPLRLFGVKMPKGVKVDDVLDACVSCWSAERVAVGSGVVLPATPLTDSRGLRMELCFGARQK